MNITESLNQRITARFQETKSPCKSYASEKKAIQVAEDLAKKVADYHGCTSPVRFVVFKAECLGRFTVAFDLTEMVSRKECQGGYLGHIPNAGFFTY